jgi:hypothetical protein
MGRFATVRRSIRWLNRFWQMKKKKELVVIILLLTAGIFIIGADWANATIRRLFHSYFADIAIPFCYYFLLVLVEDKQPRLRPWYSKAILVFMLCATSETLQFFGIYALASVFDPFDYLMYATGVLAAAFVDRILFKRFFSFWN